MRTSGVAQCEQEQAVNDEQTAAGNLNAARDAVRVFGNVLLAIRNVLAGKTFLGEKMTALMAEKLGGGRSPLQGSLVEHLSNRELEVFQWIGRGHSTRQVAVVMGISAKTVQAFCARIKDKLKLASANELLREAVRWHDSRDSQ